MFYKPENLKIAIELPQPVRALVKLKEENCGNPFIDRPASLLPVKIENGQFICYKASKIYDGRTERCVYPPDMVEWWILESDAVNILDEAKETHETKTAQRRSPRGIWGDPEIPAPA